METAAAPKLIRDSAVELDFGITLSDVRSVETFDLPTSRPQKTTVQVPEVATTRIESSVLIKLEQTLVIRTFQAGENKSQPMWMLVKVRQVSAIPDRADTATNATTDAKTALNPSPDLKKSKRPAAQPVSLNAVTGWRIRIFPRAGAPGAHMQIRSNASPGGKGTDCQITGGIRVEALATEPGSTPQSILAEADELQFSSDTGILRLSGNVHFRDGRSVLRCQRVAMRFREPSADAVDPRAGKGAASVEFEFADVQTIKFLETHGKQTQWLDGPDAEPARQGAKDPLLPERLIEKVYPVADLVIPVTLEPMVISLDGKLIENSPRPQLKPDFDALINLVTTTISPDSWASLGGHGTISWSENTMSLVIASPEIHERIAEVFSQLRLIQDVQILFTLERVEVDQANFERWANDRSGDQLDLANLKKRSASLSSQELRTFRDSVKPRTLVNCPKATVFNGQQIELCHGSPDGPRLIPGLQLLGVIAADIQSFRFTIGAGTGDGKFHRGEVSESVIVSHGKSLLIDIAQESWESQKRGISLLDKVPVVSPVFKREKPATRTFYLLTPQMMMTTEKNQTHVLSPRK